VSGEVDSSGDDASEEGGGRGRWRGKLENRGGGEAWAAALRVGIRYNLNNII
jgi:hypothetical protein